MCFFKLLMFINVYGKVVLNAKDKSDDDEQTGNNVI